MAGAPDVETRPSDRAIALAKSLASFVPGIGPIVAQIVLDDIPGQRNDRIADYVRLLDQRLTAVELAAKRDDAEAIDLFEEGAYQATRATTEAQRARIASVVANGLKGDDAARIEAKRLLGLLREIDDDQIVILLALLRENLNDQAFYERHQFVLEPTQIVLGSLQVERDKATQYDFARAQLAQLGLTRPRFKRIQKGQVPEFDEDTGMMKSSGKELTELGHLVLRRCDLATDEDV